MMMFIENLKRLAAKNFYLTINIDDDHVIIEGSHMDDWSGTLDELPEFLNEVQNDTDV